MLLTIWGDQSLGSWSYNTSYYSDRHRNSSDESSEELCM